MAQQRATVSHHFFFFPFPLNAKIKKEGYDGPSLINRQNKKGGLWLPKNSSRVCSEHFTAGKPTDDNPDPVLKLGYERKLQSKRKLPAERTEPPVKRPKTCLECLLEPDEQETTNIELVSIDVTTTPNKETGSKHYQHCGQ